MAEGTVISYGALAVQAGVPRGARWAGRELRQLPPGSELPWHRVLRSDGFLGLLGPQETGNARPCWPKATA